MIRTLHRLGPFFCCLLLLACGQQKNVSAQAQVPKKALKLFNEGYTAYQYGEYEQALELFSQALKKHPSYVDALDASAKIYQETGQNPLAISAYRKVLSMDPGHLFAKYELGQIYFATAELDSSLYFYSFFVKEAGDADKYSQHAQKRMENIRFAKRALAKPYDIHPLNLGPGLNSELEEYSPALTIDENTLYFTWRDSRLSFHRQNEDIHYSSRTDSLSAWEEAQDIGPPINTIENEGAFSISADGQYIFFTACQRSGGVGKCDIWLTQKSGDQWTEPQNLGKPINSRSWESQPSISSDGRVLYFTSDRPGGYGGTDLYASYFTDSGWSKPQNLGPEINTSEDEQFPFIHPDGHTLYFGSTGHIGMGESDLFVSDLRPDGSWEKPQNLGSPINSLGNDWNLIVSRDGKTAYFSTDRFEDGQGGMDIYSFQLPQPFRAKEVNYLKGIVLDAKTKRRIPAQVRLIPLDGSPETFTFAPKKTGEFLAALRGDQRYALKVESPGYLFYSDHFDMPNQGSKKPYVLNIQLQPIEEGMAVILKNIFFETDKAELLEESEAELRSLLAFMRDNPDQRIEIGGHTDNTGTDIRNKVLSKERADAVRNYLIKQGISEDRISAQGYASSRPIASNETEEGRALNRRTEFKLTGAQK